MKLNKEHFKLIIKELQENQDDIDNNLSMLLKEPSRLKFASDEIWKKLVIAKNSLKEELNILENNEKEKDIIHIIKVK